MFKWSVASWDSFYLMTPVYILLSIPPGYPYTDVPTQVANKLKSIKDLVVDNKKVDQVARDKIINDIPVYGFNARYEFSFQIVQSLMRKTPVDLLMKNMDVLAESPYHPVYQFAEIVDQSVDKLKSIKPEKRSTQETKFINFIQGRLYTVGSKRRSVNDAVVPGRHEICILDKHVNLDQWRSFFDEVIRIH